MTTMQVKLMESSAKGENEEQIFIDTILEIFGSVENAKDAYRDYQHVSKAMSEKHDITLTVSHIENYERWSKAKNDATTAALADRAATGDEHFQVSFNN